jgi:hypothetical protein
MHVIRTRRGARGTRASAAMSFWARWCGACSAEGWTGVLRPDQRCSAGRKSGLVVATPVSGRTLHRAQSEVQVVRGHPDLNDEPLSSRRRRACGAGREGAHHLLEPGGVLGDCLHLAVDPDALGDELPEPVEVVRSPHGPGNAAQSVRAASPQRISTCDVVSRAQRESSSA